MTEMVEKVARALCVARETDALSDCDFVYATYEEAAAGWAVFARAAIEAMREPTEGMVLAGAPMLGRPCDEEAQGYAREAYWTMIQAALEGGGKTVSAIFTEQQTCKKARHRINGAGQVLSGRKARLAG